MYLFATQVAPALLLKAEMSPLKAAVPICSEFSRPKCEVECQYVV